MYFELKFDTNGNIMKQAFHNLTDGFGINAEELGEMLTDLHDDLQLAPDVLKILSRTFFEVMDTDRNGLIDGLEYLSVMAICSGMKKTEIVEFGLSLYDFNNIAELSYDELVLALKSACSGLCKVHNPLVKHVRERLVMPSDKRLEEVASETFQKLSAGSFPSSAETKITGNRSGVSATYDLAFERKNIKELATVLLTIPEICSWLNFFCNYAERREIPIYIDEDVKDLSLMQTKLARSVDEAVIVDWTILPKRNSLGPYAQWKSQTALLTPVEYANSTLSKSFPDCKIELGWIYGYRTENCRNLLHYNRLNEIIYPISRHIIVYSSAGHCQKAMSQHVEEVSSIEMHPDRRLVASGDEGLHPEVIVWDSESLEILFRTRGHHCQGISKLSFSPNGKYLLCLDNHEWKTMTLLNWRDGSLIFKDRIEGKYSPCGVVLHKETIACVCDTKIWFWVKYSEGYVRRNGIFPKNKAEEAITTMIPTANGENIITGTIVGRLMLWIGINCIRVVKAHSSAILCLSSCHEGFLSAGKDARIRLWSNVLEPKFLFDVSRFGTMPILMGISMSIDATSILFGNQGADIFEISAIDGSDLRGGPVIKSHAFGTVNCLDTHPSKFEYTTVGSDRTVRTIDMKTRTLLKMATLDVSGLAVAYSPLGDVLAISTENVSTTASVFVILNEETLQIIHSVRDSKYSATFLKYSPEGETLAVGIQDGSIYLYSVNDDYELIARCSRHTRSIIGIDFSKDGEFIRSNSIDGELYYFNVDDGEYQSNVSAMRDILWATQSCVYSWHSKGIHSHPNDSEVTICCAVPPADPSSSVETTADANQLSIGKAQQKILVGSNLGQIRSFAYPAVHDAADHFRYQAHCGPISCIRFSFDGSLCFSVGKNDRAIIQWRMQSNDESIPAPQEGDNVEYHPEIAFELVQGQSLYREQPPRSPEASLSILNEENRNFIMNRFQWSKNIVPPTMSPALNLSLPNIPVRLEFIYGFETKTHRNNLCYNPLGEIVYTNGAYGLVWNPITNLQKVYKAHNNKITAFACSQDGGLAATGENSRYCRVTVWDTVTCVTLASLADTPVYSVCALRFSPSSQFLAVASNDQYHSVFVYDWRRGILQSKLYCGMSKLLDMVFYELPTAVTLASTTSAKKKLKSKADTETVEEVPNENSSLHSTGVADGSAPVVTSNVHLVTVGVNQILFWRGITGHFPTAIAPNWRETGHNQSFPCCEVFFGNVVVGTADGNLYIFDTGDASIKQMIKVHNGAVLTMRTSSNGKLLLTGGRDSTVRIWDKKYECMKEYPVEMLSRSVHMHIPRALVMRPDGSSILIGTQGAEILEVTMKDGSLNATTSQLRGHGNALYAIAAHPSKDNIFVTAGDDAILRVWDARTRRISKTMKLELGARAAAFHPAGNMLCVGFGTGKRVKGKLHAKEGSFALLMYDTLKIVHEGQECTSLINTMIFSPDGKYLAIGSEDNAIYTYEIQDNTFCTFLHTLRCHAAPIVSLDFSVNSHVLLSADKSNRTCYTMIATGLPISNTEEVRDESWMRYTSPISYAAQGLWLVQESKQFPTTCAKSHSGLLMASANNIGDIYVTRFPAPERVGFIRPGSHVGPVANIVWLPGDECFLSIGQEDCLIMQWRCGWQSSAFASNSSSEYSFSTQNDTNDENSSFFQIENPLNFQFQSIFHDHGADLKRDSIVASSLGLSAADSMSVTIEQHNSSAMMVLAGQDPSTFPHDNGQPTYQDFQDDNVLFQWRSMICDPSSRQSLLSNAQLPQNVNSNHVYRLEDIHYHGFQRNSMHPSLFYNPEGLILYSLSNRAVIYDRNTQQQRFYMGHVAEISAMNMSQDRMLVATADRQSYPEIHIWDSYVAREVKIFKGYHRYNVRALSFSYDSRFLLSIGEDSYHSLVVFFSPSGQWRDGYYLSSSSVSLGNIGFCLYTTLQPLYPMLVGGEDGYLHLFRHVQGTLEHVTQRLDSQQRIQSLLCAAETQLLTNDGLELMRPCVLVGSSVGFLYALTLDVTVPDSQSNINTTNRSNAGDKGSCQVLHRISAHDGPLFGIMPIYSSSHHLPNNSSSNQSDKRDLNSVVPLPQSIVTVGRDCCLRIWSCKLQLMHTLELNKLLESTHGFSLATRLAYSGERHSLLIGLAQGDLFEFSFLGKTSSLITEGHDRGELHGVCSNPVVPEEFMTVGDDGIVRVWHRSVRYVSRRATHLRVACRAICIAPDGLSVMVGVGRPGHSYSHPKDGSLIVLRTSDLAILREERKGKKHITDIVISSDGQLAAAACYDGRVFVCEYATLATRHVIDVDTRRPALRLDFAMDDSVLRIAFLPDKMTYFSLDREAIVDNTTEIRDVVWRSHNCVFSWATQGAFLPKAPFQPRRLDTDEIVLDEADVVDPVALNESAMGGSHNDRFTESRNKQTAAVAADAAANAPATPVVSLPIVTAIAVHKPGKCMVVAYEDGLVSLFPFPSLSRDSEIELCRAATYVSRICFSADFKTVIMIEAGSRAVIQASIAFPSTSPLLIK
jgi:WD40 repeat protein/Ca2+-binding EF-hand superfamily protein